ncbi:orotidine-5'-phosphate decarboxylase [Elsinoe ampelina]|uniref:Orotidine 5'-phosphate decarboxylase n=1 Tax=Elsinoe ampelina TaxID=302913 RepID=A0A6A6G046_9PEZI|nr:orotidine-5'-phosphate decarboxylase [Elsinoe ampelina]
MHTHPSRLQTYLERATIPGTSPLAAYFLKLIVAKKSNLCVSADVTTSRELLALAEEVGDQICLLKTHADIIHDFGHNTAQSLQAIAKRKGFLIFEDRKFADIGTTVQLQYTAGPLQIVRWANIVNAHILPGAPIVTALAQAADDAPPMARALLLIAQMSSKGNLLDQAYAEESLRNARAKSDFVMGFIAQESLNTEPGDNFITMTPGVNISSKGDDLGQQYNTPEYLVGDKGTDVIIVGRGIYGAQDRRAVAEEYRVRAWKAYEARVGGT